MTDEIAQRIAVALEEQNKLLRSIAGCLGAWAQHQGVHTLGQGASGGAPRSSSGKSDAMPRGSIAADRDLDGQYGDPKVICDPRNWSGTSYKGGRMSEAPADYLDELAEVLDGFADDETDEKKRRYKRGDAAKARAWARRKRAAEQPPPAAEEATC